MIRADLAQLKAYVPGKKLENAIKLSSNENFNGPLPAAVAAMTEAAGQVNRYPDAAMVELREALAAHLGLSFDQITVGAGSSALCQQLVQITCLERTDEVIFPWPSFEAYPLFVHVVGGTNRMIPLTADYRLDLDAMAEAINDNTRLIFVCNPNNPTSTTITQAEFDEFMAKVPDNVLVGLDEAYFEYNLAGDTPIATEAIEKYPNVVGLRTFSKAFGLADLRVGYAFGAPEIIEAMAKVAAPFAVSNIAQKGALASLKAVDQLLEHVEDTAAQRDRATAALSDCGALQSQSNFIFLPAAKLPLAPHEVAAKLADQGIVVRPSDFGVRISITNQEETDALLKAWDAAGF